MPHNQNTSRPLLLTNARVIDPSRDLDMRGDLLISDGVIRDARQGIAASGAPDGAEVIDCTGCIVAPGLVDMRAFVGEPGASYRETFASASEAAAAGGITTIICQPDTSPVIDNSATVDFVLRRARDTAIVNIHPMAALTKGMAGQVMTEFGLLKAAGAVAFTDGAHSVMNAQVMRRALTYARDFDALIVHYTEDPNLVGEGVMNEGEFSTRLGLIGVPAAAEAMVLERDIRLVALTGGRYHAASVTCRESLEILQRAKDAGLRVSASASINHLALNENDIGPYRTFLKTSPPLRTEDDRTALVAAVASGLVDVAMSDHNPQDVETKRLPFAEAAVGAIGLETMLSAGLRLVHNDEIKITTLIRAMSTRPAELLKLPGGTLRGGAPADVIVIDPDEPWVLDPADLKSQCKNTPFDEARFTGRVRQTVVGGRSVYRRA
ncbi:MAG: dihydroorotase [Rhizobiales bacterium]|nr:dihydroorotase [Hyphomicrobiales bacterium]